MFVSGEKLKREICVDCTPQQIESFFSFIYMQMLPHVDYLKRAYHAWFLILPLQRNS